MPKAIFYLLKGDDLLNACGVRILLQTDMQMQGFVCI